MTTLLLLNAVIVIGWMCLFWLISIPICNIAIIDIAWGLGFVLVAWASAFFSESEAINRWLLPILVTIWGIRLSGYLFWRNYGKPEDKRYRTMRDLRGSAFWYFSLWIVFIPQGLLILLVSLPVQMGVFHAIGGWHLLHFFGCALWLIGMSFETIGDFQLASFLADPNSRGKVMNKGLWKFTRHPNYFGDFLVWWGFYCVAMAATWTNLWWTIIGPLAMSFLLMRVSGVPLLEQSLKTTRVGYADYVQRTNGFFPWWPREMISHD